ncbi:alkaline phosphatase family protein [Microlunatus sp. Y2014]|uniref:alkaline phosphatase family protein n=1 Tax=Microlunatus sp. Y2014 TaxID=3418488 RepID=UPI003DA71030
MSPVDLDGPLPPQYGRNSLIDLLPSIAAAQGVPGFDNLLGLPSAPRWVVLMVDGLGWHNLDAAREHAPYLSALASRRPPVTVSVPSTTTTSLSGLGTGRPPGQHGMVGYTFRLPRAKGAVLNALSWEVPHSPRFVQPVPTVFEELTGQVATATVSLARFAESGLTEAALRGPEFVGLRDENDERVRTERILSRVTGAERTLVYAYERRLDMTGHTDGWQSEAWRAQLARLDGNCRTLAARLPADAVLVVTGDHGMVDVPTARQLVVEDEPDLLADVDCLAGEGRFRQLYVDGTDPTVVAARWRARLGDDAWVRTRDEAIGEGWFGPVDPAMVERLGHVLVAMRGDAAVMTRTAPHELSLVGMHGSLTPTEMLVPLIMVPGGTSAPERERAR